MGKWRPAERAFSARLAGSFCQALMTLVSWMPERIESTETGSGGTPLETDDCLAGVDREKTVHAQRGKREPAVAPVQSGENPIQAVSRNADFSQRGMELDDVKVWLSIFAH
jgi:hypothetical protein